MGSAIELVGPSARGSGSDVTQGDGAATFPNVHVPRGASAYHIAVDSWVPLSCHGKDGVHNICPLECISHSKRGKQVHPWLAAGYAAPLSSTAFCEAYGSARHA